MRWHRWSNLPQAGRSGRAITFVTQYDVELFQRIEALIGLKMATFPTDEDAAMMLKERVQEASRIAALVCLLCNQLNLKEMKEENGGKKRKRDDDDEDGEEKQKKPFNKGGKHRK